MKLSKSGKTALIIAAGTVIGVAVGVALYKKPIKKKVGKKIKSMGEKGMEALHLLRETLDKLDDLTATLKNQGSHQQENT